MSNRTPLTSEEIETALSKLPEWRFENDCISRRFEFSTFKEAISFLVRASFEAESLNHHPELVNVYNRVDVTLSTHDAGNKVTQMDIDLASAIERFSWT